MNRGKGGHHRESGNPERNWNPGQAWNDKPEKNYGVMYISNF
jgi:hypothetical protein